MAKRESWGTVEIYRLKKVVMVARMPSKCLLCRYISASNSLRTIFLVWFDIPFIIPCNSVPTWAPVKTKLPHLISDIANLICLISLVENLKGEKIIVIHLLGTVQ